MRCLKNLKKCGLGGDACTLHRIQTCSVLTHGAGAACVEVWKRMSGELRGEPAAL